MLIDFIGYWRLINKEEQYFIICLPIISLTENVWEVVINFQLFYAGLYDSLAKSLECCLVNMAPEKAQRKKCPECGASIIL